MDISSKLDHTEVEVLVEIALLMRNLHLSFFVIGATARDIVFEAIFDLPIKRATLDMDFGIRVRSWTEYNHLRDEMLRLGHFENDKKKVERMHHISGKLVDLVPFGPVEEPSGMILWPPDKDIVMRTVGFEEALQSSIDVTVSHDPETVVKVCTPAALAVMKIISWRENYPARKKDAEDLFVLLKDYIKLGNEMRLYEADLDLHEDKEFDFDTVGARLLGRDITKLASPETLGIIKNIMDQETADESNLNLISDMISGIMRDDQSANTRLKLLKQLNKGLWDMVR